MILTDYFNDVKLVQSGSNTSKTRGPSSPITIINNKLKKLLADNVIDGNEYTTITKIIHTNGLLSNAHTYFNFLNKLQLKQLELGGDDVLYKDITIIIKNFKKVFAHIHYLINDNQINKNVLITEIENYNNKNFILTTDQSQAAYDIAQFIYNPSILKHGLNGLPGAGKTILITKIIHYLLGNKYIKSIVFAASTNKAVNVIKSKFRNDLDNLFQNTLNIPILNNETFDDILDKLEEHGLKIHFLTIHKLLGYKNEYDGDGERIFVRGQNTLMNKYELVIIDEISMINFNIVYHLFDDTVTKNTKILFVGDEGQLTPVKEDISIIFAKQEKEFRKVLFEEAYANNKNIDMTLLEEEINSKFKNFKLQIMSLKYSTLNTVMRTNNDSVVQLCNELRKKIFNIKYVPQFFKCKSDKVYMYKYDNTLIKINSDWFKKYVEYLQSTNNDKCSSLILTWTNNQTNEYNNCMRKLLFNKDVLDKFEVGDILVLADFYNMKDDYKTSNDNRFYSSEQIKITKIEHVTKGLSMFVENLLIQKTIDNLAGLLDIKEKYIRTIRAINKLTNRNYNVWKLHVVKLSSIITSTDETYCIYVVDDTSIETLDNDKKIAGDKILELINYYKAAHKEHFNVIDEYIIRKLWKEYNNKFVDTFAKVNMSYAMTTHKSQGSTFHNVFIDMIDILKNFSKIDAYRCLYTAISRTANEVHILY
jgi:hypothetical protein